MNSKRNGNLLEECSVKNLSSIASDIRLKIVDSIYNAHSGHPGGSLSIVEIVTYLYFHRMNINPEDPDDSKRDRFVLSKGHCAPTLYAALAIKGFFSEDELNYLRKIKHMLQGHPDKKHIPGIDMSSGSLGQGISAACGMALASKKNGIDYDVYCVLGDGELQEGQVWEAAMFAAHHKLNNLCAFVDYNNLQISGSISDVMSLGDIGQKFKSFGWEVLVINGHDYYQIDKAWEAFSNNATQPTVIVCNTVKGKGVSFMENNFYWHGNPPNEIEHKNAMEELCNNIQLH